MHKTRSLTIEEKTALVLGTAMILGAVVRFAPGILAGFPLHDGGMFYSMILDLRESHYLLPKTTSYSFFAIPYVYPPFGFYLARILLDTLHVLELSLLRWLPLVISTLSIVAFYLLAKEILGASLRGTIASAFYTLTPGSFSWFIMGGGLTRALGSLFLLLAVWSVYRLFKLEKKRFLFYAILFCTLAVVSHPNARIGAVPFRPAFRVLWDSPAQSHLAQRLWGLELPASFTHGGHAVISLQEAPFIFAPVSGPALPGRVP